MIVKKGEKFQKIIKVKESESENKINLYRLNFNNQYHISDKDNTNNIINFEIKII